MYTVLHVPIVIGSVCRPLASKKMRGIKFHIHMNFFS